MTIHVPHAISQVECAKQVPHATRVRAFNTQR